MFTKTNKPDGTPMNPTQDAIRGAASKPAARVGASIFCSDMTIVGSVKSDGAMQVDGRVEGNITAADVTIGSSGNIEGEIIADTLKIKGSVNGSIRAKKVELESGARVQGDIIHSALIIQPDAHFEGQVKRSEDPLKNSSASSSSKASSASTQRPATQRTSSATSASFNKAG